MKKIDYYFLSIFILLVNITMLINHYFNAYVIYKKSITIGNLNAPVGFFILLTLSLILLIIAVVKK